MSEFVDETEALQANIEGLKHLGETLATFNESFASWLYIMNMNALTTDWPQAPTDVSFMLARKRAEQNALAAMEAIKARAAAEAEAAAAAASMALLADRTVMTDFTEGETTYTGNMTTTISAQSSSAKSGLPTKKKAKHKPSAKEKKERSIEIERIISCLPLEFRGSDPNLRRNMEMVIEGIMNAPDHTVKLPDLITPPDLTQARVNKCLIALVNRKVVQKDNSTGTVLYRWQGLP